MTDKVAVGRLAFRSEGELWNAYYLMYQDSMKDALFLGSIRMALVRGNEMRKHAFMDLMKECFSDVAEDLFGARPDWLPDQPAPEHERTKE